jgi:hypothetical protein
VAWGRIWSAVLVQAKVWQHSFQPSMMARIVSTRSWTEAKLPGRMAWRVMIENPLLEAPPALQTRRSEARRSPLGKFT